MNNVSSNIFSGSFELLYVSFPNYPSSPTPQEYTTPFEFKANVWVQPQATYVILFNCIFYGIAS